MSGISNEKESWSRSLTWESYKGMSGEIIVKPELKNNYWEDIRKFLINANIVWAKEWKEKIKNIVDS